MLSSTSPSSVSTITSMDVGSASSSVEPVHRSLAVAGNSSMARHYQESSGWMNNMMCKWHNFWRVVLKKESMKTKCVFSLSTLPARLNKGLNRQVVCIK